MKRAHDLYCDRAEIKNMDDLDSVIQESIDGVCPVYIEMESGVNVYIVHEEFFDEMLQDLDALDWYKLHYPQKTSTQLH